MKKILSSILIIFSISFQLTLHAQSNNWEWDWAYNSNDSAVGPVLSIISSDRMNNYYFYAPYVTDIYFPDTSFHHSGNYSSNCVIAKYNTNGKLLNTLDIYTMPNLGIRNVESVTDYDKNVYIAGSFQERIFFQNTYLNHGNNPYIEHPDVFILKLNQDYEVIWADIISGSFQDRMDGIAISQDEKIYIATSHYGTISAPTTVSYLSQDTVSFNTNFISVTQFNTDKSINWRRDVLGVGFEYLRMGKDGNIYLFGNALQNIIIDDDTLFNPNNPVGGNCSFVVSFSPTGQVLQKRFLDPKIYNIDFIANADGTHYLSGYIIDTAVFNQDTLINPPNYTKLYIAKTDHDFNYIWYKIYEERNSDWEGYFKLNSLNNKAIFTINIKRDFEFCDTLLHLGVLQSHIIGMLNTNGDLVNIKSIKRVSSISSNKTFLDQCSKLVFGFYFMGTAYLGEDTVKSFKHTETDGLLARLSLEQQEPFSLGKDTTVCNQLTIFGPENYQYYLWNDSIENESSLTVSQSGEYNLAYSNNNICWQYDTIFIQIDESFQISLGLDTLIKLTDSIQFILGNDYDSYLWSDGTETNTMLAVGSQYGVGDFPIWVNVTKGVCEGSDTISLKIVDGSGIAEINNQLINISPIPCHDVLNISFKNTPSYKHKLLIFNLNGRLLQKLILKNKKTILNVENLKTGHYILLIEDSKYNIYQAYKFLKN